MCWNRKQCFFNSAWTMFNRSRLHRRGFKKWCIRFKYSTKLMDRKFKNWSWSFFDQQIIDFRVMGFWLVLTIVSRESTPRPPLPPHDKSHQNGIRYGLCIDVNGRKWTWNDVNGDGDRHQSRRIWTYMDVNGRIWRALNDDEGLHEKTPKIVVPNCRPVACFY